MKCPQCGTESDFKDGQCHACGYTPTKVHLSGLHAQMNPTRHPKATREVAMSGIHTQLDVGDLSKIRPNLPPMTLKTRDLPIVDDLEELLNLADEDKAPTQTPALSGIQPQFQSAKKVEDAQLWLQKGDQARDQGQVQEAFQAYEKAFQANKQWREPIDHMLSLAQEVKDYVRISRCWATLSQLVDDPKMRAEYLIQSAYVTRDGRKEPSKAALGLRQALELDPERLDAFLALTEIYASLREWEPMRDAYQRMIQLHAQRDPANGLLLSKLWRKLAALLATRLHRYEDAIVAIQSALRYAPQDLKNLATQFEIYRQWDGHVEESIQALHQLLEWETEFKALAQNIRLLSEIFIEAGEVDGTLCSLRVLKAMGQADELELAFVNERQKSMPKVPRVELSAEQWRRWIYPKNFPFQTARIYALLALAINPILGRDVEFYGLSYKTKLDLNNPLLFSRLMRETAAFFKLSPMPEVFVKDGEVGALGMLDALLDPPGFIVSKSLLSGKRPQEIAFVIARSLAFQKQLLYMASICRPKQLKGYLMAALKAVKPDAPIAETRSTMKIVKAIQSSLKEEQQEELKHLIFGHLENNKPIDVDLYMRTSDQTAHRLALIICDDLSVVSEMIAKTSDPSKTQNLEQRRHKLYQYAVSPEYLALRHHLGLAVRD